MPLDLQLLINNPFVLRFASLLARTIPPRIGYPFCDRIGNWVATQREARVTRAVRINQWVARGANLSEAALDKAVRETLQNNARDIYNLYHYLGRSEDMRAMIRFTPEAYEILQRPEFGDRGLILLGIHLSNFDFVLRYSISQLGSQPLVLTIPDPQGGRRLEYEMRKQIGMNLVPASVGTLRGAIRHLENGGTIVTGLDHPVPEPPQKPIFFGRPAWLPIYHIHLATKARVPIAVMATIQQLDGKYHVFRSDFIEIESHLDAMRNAERVLKQAEEFIRLAPQQWNVPLPVWPDVVVSG